MSLQEQINNDIKEAMKAKWRGDIIGGCVVHP